MARIGTKADSPKKSRTIMKSEQRIDFNELQSYKDEICKFLQKTYNPAESERYGYSTLIVALIHLKTVRTVYDDATGSVSIRTPRSIGRISNDVVFERLEANFGEYITKTGTRSRIVRFQRRILTNATIG